MYVFFALEVTSRYSSSLADDILAATGVLVSWPGQASLRHVN